MEALRLAALGRILKRTMMQRIDDVFAEQKAHADGKATPQQVKTIYSLLKRHGLPIPPYDLGLLPYGNAVAIITELTRP